jgi:GNAT superfamily N-acetyltransferase
MTRPPQPPPPHIAIVPLADRPDVVPTLAGWHHAQWGWMNPGRETAERIAEFAAHLQTERVPTTFVAFEGDVPVGSASIIAHDLPTRMDLTPWLASVYVVPAARGRGVASALVDTVVAFAARLDVETLYLFTPDQMRLYASLGWVEQEKVVHHGETETIMRIRPADRIAGHVAPAR